MESLIRTLSVCAILALVVGCMSPVTAMKIGAAKSEVHRLGAGKPGLDYSLANTNGLSKEQIATKEAELYAKVRPAVEKYDNQWASDLGVAGELVKQTHEVTPLIDLQEKTKSYDRELSIALEAAGLKGTNSWQFPNGKVISRLEFVRELTAATERGLAAGMKGAQEINNSRDFAANTAQASILLLGAAAGAAAQNPIPQPAYPATGGLIPHPAPTSATTYIGGGPQYGGYTGTTIYH
jgi:hypothetical protein